MFSTDEQRAVAKVTALKEKARDPGAVPVFLTPLEPKEPQVKKESSPAKSVEPLIRIPWKKNLAERGAEILEKNGEFPPIVARYERLGFKAYLSTITAQAGARVFLGEVQRKRLVAEVIPQDGELKPVGSLAGLAVQRPRIITVPGDAEFIHKAREQFGPGDYQMVVLFPAATESWIVGGLAQRMKENGRDPPSISRVEGSYHLNKGRLILAVTGVIDKQGGMASIRALFDLTEVSHAP
jgi:hypothetical protein